MNKLRTPEVEDLLEVFSQVSDKDELFALFEDLFTVREIKDISQRLMVARLLDAGCPYSRIEAAASASASTIARVSRALNYGPGGYARALEVLGTRDADAHADCTKSCPDVCAAKREGGDGDSAAEASGLAADAGSAADSAHGSAGSHDSDGAAR